jgi:hypothetical protein
MITLSVIFLILITISVFRLKKSNWYYDEIDPVWQVILLLGVILFLFFLCALFIIIITLTIKYLP